MKTKEQKRREAEQRKKDHESLTLEQRLAKLDAGGYRAKRERARILRQMKGSK